MKNIRFFCFLLLCFFLKINTYSKEIVYSDSLVLEKLVEIENKVSEYKVAKDLINNDITIFTVLVSFIMLFFTIIIAYIIPKNTKSIIDNKINPLDSKTNDIEKNLNKGLVKIYETNIRATRSLYESKNKTDKLKFIWSIRYIAAIKDLLEVKYSNKLHEDYIKRIDIAKKDLENLPDNEITKLQSLENFNGIITIIKEISIDSNESVRIKSTELLKLLLNKLTVIK